MSKAEKEKHDESEATETQKTAKGHVIPVPTKKQVLGSFTKIARKEEGH